MDDTQKKSNPYDVYFVNKDSKQRAQILLTKAGDWFTVLNSNGYLDKIRTLWAAYHGAYYDESHQINFGGEQGELTQIAINHIRNISSILLNMVTATRPSMQAKAINTDYKSVIQTKLANDLLDYYMREHRVEQKIKTAVEYALNMGSGAIKVNWNANSGEVYDYNEETKTEIREGDLEFTNLSVFDVYFDTHREDNKHDWVLIRTYKNRFDIAAKYPELESKILSLPTKDKLDVFASVGIGMDDTDLVPVYEFYHRRTESVPDGMYHQFLSDEITLIEGPSPYRDIPVYTIAPSYYLGTPFPYTPMFDLIPIQDAINSLYSIALTNQTAFGVQSVLVPQGANLSVSQLSGGLHIIEANEQNGTVRPLQLTQTPKELFDNIKMLESVMQIISGVNSVSRGNPDPNLRSGNALALVQSMTLQYISGLQQSYVNLIENLGTGIINILKDHAMVPRMAAIVGKTNASKLETFKGDDLSLVNRVVVDIGNPLAKTTAGRVEMAEQLLQMGAIRTPEQYFSVINTGNLDMMTEGEQNQLFLVKAENEKMVAGQEILALWSDEHALHIKEHSSVLSDPALRFNPDLVALVSNHIQEHVNLLQSTNPELLMILGQQPLQPPMPPKEPPPPPDQQGGMMPPQGDIAPPELNPMGNAVTQNPVNPSLEQVGAPPVPTRLPKVDPNLLVNPQLQQAAMGNLKLPPQ